MSTVGILTVGDELLAGDVENTNATWLADRLTARGVDVGEIRVVPDDTERIAAAVAELAARFASVVVTGGLGSTPDDLTLMAVARALDRPLETNEEARELVAETVREIEAEYPDFEFDLDAAARFPSGGRPISNDEGIAPGCVIEGVYVIPGVPAEMKAVFERVVDEFAGEVRSRTVYSDVPESNLNPLLTELRDRFEVRVGCYPEDDRRRLKVSSSDLDRLERAYEWVRDRPEIEE